MPPVMSLPWLPLEQLQAKSIRWLNQQLADVKESKATGIDLQGSNKAEIINLYLALQGTYEERKEHTVQGLVNRGFSLRQLIQFCIEKLKEGKLKQDMTTGQVVKVIIIPETAESNCAYMDSSFMATRGGPKQAKHLVSHAWGTPFLTTVANIVLDASNLRAQEVWWYFAENRDPSLIERLTTLLEKLTEFQLDKIIYWLCIFAVKEHLAICGDCFKCNAQHKWVKEDYAKSHCNCGPKFNPCECGSLKTPEGPDYEIDKFADVVTRMESLVVSLDPDLTTLERIWVVSEIAEAMQAKPVNFRICSDLSGHCIHKLVNGKPLVTELAKCKATSETDRQRILLEVEQKHASHEIFDNFLFACTDVRFGRFHRLEQLPQVTLASFGRMKDLEINLQPLLNGTKSTNLEITGISPASLSKLSNLQRLLVDASHCEELEDIDSLARSLTQLTSLRQLTLCFRYTTFSNIESLGNCLGELKLLTLLVLDFHAACVYNIDALGHAIGNLTSLTSLDLCFSTRHIIDKGFFKCISNIDILGRSVSNLASLTCLKLDFFGSINNIDHLSHSIAKLNSLTQLELSFQREEISNIDALANSIGTLTSLTSLNLQLSLTSLGSLENSIRNLTKLSDFVLALNMFVSGSDKFPPVLRQFFRDRDSFLQACGAAADQLNHWKILVATAKPEQVVEKLFADITTLSLSVAGFQQHFSDVVDLGPGIAAFPALKTLQLNLRNLRGLRRIDCFAERLSSLTSIQKLTLNFEGCRRLAGIDQLFVSICKLKNLEKLQLSFQDTQLQDLGSLAKNISNLTLLKTLQLDLSRSQIDSVVNLVDAILSLTTLDTVELDFCRCGNLPRHFRAKLVGRQLLLFLKQGNYGRYCPRMHQLIEGFSVSSCSACNQFCDYWNGPDFFVCDECNWSICPSCSPYGPYGACEECNWYEPQADFPSFGIPETGPSELSNEAKEEVSNAEPTETNKALQPMIISSTPQISAEDAKRSIVQRPPRLGIFGCCLPRR
jgi:hypothetical protein